MVFPCILRSRAGVALPAYPFEDPRKISRGVFHELLIRGVRTAADFFRHRLQHGFALGLFVPEPLNARGDHGAHRREFAPLHQHLGGSVVFIDEGDGGFDSHIATVSRSHTTISIKQPEVVYQFGFSSLSKPCFLGMTWPFMCGNPRRRRSQHSIFRQWVDP